MVGFFLAMGFMGSFNLGLFSSSFLWSCDFFIYLIFILTVVICTKTQEIVDGYIVLLGIMGWIINLFIFELEHNLMLLHCWTWKALWTPLSNLS